MVFLGGTPRCLPRGACTFRGELGFSGTSHAAPFPSACRSLLTSLGLHPAQKSPQFFDAIQRNSINLCRIFSGRESGSNDRGMGHGEVMLHLLFDAHVTGKYSLASAALLWYSLRRRPSRSRRRKHMVAVAQPKAEAHGGRRAAEGGSTWWPSRSRRRERMVEEQPFRAVKRNPQNIVPRASQALAPQGRRILIFPDKDYRVGSSKHVWQAKFQAPQQHLGKTLAYESSFVHYRVSSHAVLAHFPRLQPVKRIKMRLPCLAPDARFA